MRVGGPGLFGEESLRAGYRQIQCPVDVLVGEEPDTWGDLPKDVAAARVACIPNGTLTTVPGAGHYIHIERPDAVLAALDDVVARAGRLPQSLRGGRNPPSLGRGMGWFRGNRNGADLSHRSPDNWGTDP